MLELSLSSSLQQCCKLNLSLVQRLGLESRYLSSCLPRTETMLKERRYQRGLALLRERGEDGFRSVLDFLLVLFLPSIRPAVIAFYNEEGPCLVEAADAAAIAVMDGALAARVVELVQLNAELSRSRTGAKAKSAIVDAYLDCFARPSFPGQGRRYDVPLDVRAAA